MRDSRASCYNANAATSGASSPTRNQQMARTLSVMGVRAGAVGLAAALLGLFVSPQASALDLHRRFTVGFRVGDFLPGDSQQGGFRAFGSGAAGQPGRHAVSLSEVPVPTFQFGYGVANL